MYSIGKSKYKSPHLHSYTYGIPLDNQQQKVPIIVPGNFLKNRATHQGVFFKEQGVFKKRLDVLIETPRGFKANALTFSIVS